jgi:hypothetical protein
MTDVIHPTGWWMASDGNCYPPHLHPDAVAPPGEPMAPMAPAVPPGSAPLPALPQFPQFPQFPPGGPPGPVVGSAPPPAYGYYSGPPYAPRPDVPPGYGYPAPTSKVNGLAIVSLVLSILTLLGIGSIIGIILGFVSRSQIRQSHGTQRGDGLGLAGIIVGFVTLSLVLLAVAIPTFLGVSAKASTGSVVHLAPVPIVLGALEQGGTASPMTWGPRTQPVDTTVSPVAGGADVAIASPEHAEFVGAPVDHPYPAIQETASVAVVAGPTTNGIGLGCGSPDQSDDLAFFIHSTGQWDIVAWTTRANVVVDAGSSAAIHPTGANALTIACRNDLARPGTTQLSFEINGTPVANDLVKVSSAAWYPTVQLCSCHGPDTGRFLDVGYYFTSATSTTSAT